MILRAAANTLARAMFAEGAILDEVQRCPALFSWLQGVVDARGRMGDFILTGPPQRESGKVLPVIRPLPRSSFMAERVNSSANLAGSWVGVKPAYLAGGRWADRCLWRSSSG